MPFRPLPCVVALGLLFGAGCDVREADPRASWLQATLIDDNRIMLERSPELTAGKFRKMAQRPYYWFRGNMAVFVADTTRPGPGYLPTAYGSGPASRVLLLGDPHPENLGSYRPEPGVLVFEYNDFDGATYGPFHQDVRRLGLGFAVAMLEAGQPPEAIERMARAAAQAYVDEIAAQRAGMVPYSVVDGGEVGPIVADLFRRARRDGNDREALDEYTVVENGARSMFYGQVEAPVDGVVRDEVHPVDVEQTALVEALMAGYPETLVRSRAPGFFAIKGISRRIGAGVSSYALQRYYVLVEGPTPDLDDDRLVEIKEILDPTTPSRSPHLNSRAFTGNGQRAVQTQRALQRRPDCDPLLGWSAAPPIQARMRERTKFQKGIDVGRIVDRLAENRWSLDDVEQLATHAGRLLGSSHARAPTQDDTPGLVAIAAALGDDGAGFVTETVVFVREYLPRLEADYALFRALVEQEGPWLGYRPVSH